MTQKTLSSLIFTIAFSLSSFAVLANSHSTKTETEQTSKEVKTTANTDHSGEAKKMPVSASDSDSHSKAPHGKTNAPHMEELPHIHKYHRERVKKIKKHHTKLWILSQALVVICNLSILVIAYLHLTH